MSKYQLMTHTDLDGVGCAILAKLYLKDVDVCFCNTNSINDKVIKFLEEKEKDTTYLMITDISVSEEVAYLLEQVKDLKVVLLDHHYTGMELNKYKWAHVIVETRGHLHSGTELFYQYLKDELKPIENVIHTEFVELVRLYDTWDWERENKEKASWLNDLMQFEGLYRFFEERTKKLEYGKIFTNEDHKILEIIKENKEGYIHRKLKSIIRIQVGEYQIGYVFGEQYISELGNAIAETYEDIDIVAIFTGRRVSLRSVKETLHLGEWSKANYGGGGHQLSAGISVSNEKLHAVATLLFEK